MGCCSSTGTATDVPSALAPFSQRRASGGGAGGRESDTATAGDDGHGQEQPPQMTMREYIDDLFNRGEYEYERLFEGYGEGGILGSGASSVVLAVRKKDTGDCLTVTFQ